MDPNKRAREVDTPARTPARHDFSRPNFGLGRISLGSSCTSSDGEGPYKRQSREHVTPVASSCAEHAMPPPPPISSGQTPNSNALAERRSEGNVHRHKQHGVSRPFTPSSASASAHRGSDQVGPRSCAPQSVQPVHYGRALSPESGQHDLGLTRQLRQGGGWMDPKCSSANTGAPTVWRELFAEHENVPPSQARQSQTRRQDFESAGTSSQQQWTMPIAAQPSQFGYNGVHRPRAAAPDAAGVGGVVNASSPSTDASWSSYCRDVAEIQTRQAATAPASHSAPNIPLSSGQGYRYQQQPQGLASQSKSTASSPRVPKPGLSNVSTSAPGSAPFVGSPRVGVTTSGWRPVTVQRGQFQQQGEQRTSVDAVAPSSHWARGHAANASPWHDTQQIAESPYRDGARVSGGGIPSGASRAQVPLCHGEGASASPPTSRDAYGTHTWPTSPEVQVNRKGTPFRSSTCGETNLDATRRKDNGTYVIDDDVLSVASDGDTSNSSRPRRKEATTRGGQHFTTKPQKTSSRPKAYASNNKDNKGETRRRSRKISSHEMSNRDESDSEIKGFVASTVQRGPDPGGKRSRVRRNDHDMKRTRKHGFKTMRHRDGVHGGGGRSLERGRRGKSVWADDRDDSVEIISDIGSEDDRAPLVPGVFRAGGSGSKDDALDTDDESSCDEGDIGDERPAASGLFGRLGHFSILKGRIATDRSEKRYAKPGDPGEWQQVEDGSRWIMKARGPEGGSLTAADGIDGESTAFSISAELYERMYKHQRVGVRWLWGLHQGDMGGILGDDMGLGKTFQVTCLLAGLFATEQASSALIVAPKGVMRGWEKELKKWLVAATCPMAEVTVLTCEMSARAKESAISKALDGGLVDKGAVLITSYGLVSAKKEMFAPRGSSQKWDYVVLDEGHKVKNRATRTCKAVHFVPAKKRLLLSGTPVQNNLKELHTLVDWITFGALLGSYKHFESTFASVITSGQDKTASEAVVQRSRARAAELREVLAPHLLERKKTEIMPQEVIKTEMVLWVALSERQRRQYAFHLGGESVQAVLKGTISSPLAAIQALKKICLHPVVSSHPITEPWVLEERHAVRDLVEGSSKLSITLDIVEDTCRQGNRVLVFSRFVRMLDVIERCIGARTEEGGLGLRLARIDGTHSDLEREDTIARFNADPRLAVCLVRCLGNNCKSRLSAGHSRPLNAPTDFAAVSRALIMNSTGAGGTGITLTGANRVIIYDPSWNPADDMQAVDRAYRLGQTRDVLVYRMIAAGTVEEKIYEKQMFKDGLRQTIMGGKTKRKKHVRYFSRAELRELFTLFPPGVCRVLAQLDSMHGTLRARLTASDREAQRSIALDGLLDFLENDVQGCYGVSAHGEGVPKILQTSKTEQLSAEVGDIWMPRCEPNSAPIIDLGEDESDLDEDNKIGQAGFKYDSDSWENELEHVGMAGTGGISYRRSKSRRFSGSEHSHPASVAGTNVELRRDPDYFAQDGDDVKSELPDNDLSTGDRESGIACSAQLTADDGGLKACAESGGESSGAGNSGYGNKRDADIEVEYYSSDPDSCTLADAGRECECGLLDCASCVQTVAPLDNGHICGVQVKGAGADVDAERDAGPGKSVKSECDGSPLKSEYVASSTSRDGDADEDSSDNDFAILPRRSMGSQGIEKDRRMRCEAAHEEPHLEAEGSEGGDGDILDRGGLQQDNASQNLDDGLGDSVEKSDSSSVVLIESDSDSAPSSRLRRHSMGDGSSSQSSSSPAVDYRSDDSDVIDLSDSDVDMHSRSPPSACFPSRKRPEQKERDFRGGNDQDASEPEAGDCTTTEHATMLPRFYSDQSSSEAERAVLDKAGLDSCSPDGSDSSASVAEVNANAAEGQRQREQEARNGLGFPDDPGSPDEGPIASVSRASHDSEGESTNRKTKRVDPAKAERVAAARERARTFALRELGLSVSCGRASSDAESRASDGFEAVENSRRRDDVPDEDPGSSASGMLHRPSPVCPGWPLDSLRHPKREGMQRESSDVTKYLCVTTGTPRAADKKECNTGSYRAPSSQGKHSSLHSFGNRVDHEASIHRRVEDLAPAGSSRDQAPPLHGHEDVARDASTAINTSEGGSRLAEREERARGDSENAGQPQLKSPAFCPPRKLFDTLATIGGTAEMTSAGGPSEIHTAFGDRRTSQMEQSGCEQVDVGSTTRGSNMYPSIKMGLSVQNSWVMTREGHQGSHCEGPPSAASSYQTAASAEKGIDCPARPARHCHYGVADEGTSGGSRSLGHGLDEQRTCSSSERSLRKEPEESLATCDRTGSSLDTRLNISQGCAIAGQGQSDVYRSFEDEKIKEGRLQTNGQAPTGGFSSQMAVVTQGVSDRDSRIRSSLTPAFADGEPTCGNPLSEASCKDPASENLCPPAEAGGTEAVLPLNERCTQDDAERAALPRNGASTPMGVVTAGACSVTSSGSGRVGAEGVGSCAFHKALAERGNYTCEKCRCFSGIEAAERAQQLLLEAWEKEREGRAFAAMASCLQAVEKCDDDGELHRTIRRIASRIGGFD